MILLALALAWTLGIYLGVQADLPLAALALFLLGAAIFTLLLQRAGRSLLLGFFLVALVLGTLRGEVASTEGGGPAIKDYHNAGPVQLRGLVSEYPTRAGSATRVRLAVESVQVQEQWQQVSGDLLVTLRESSELVRQRDKPYFRYGDRLLLQGTVEEPPVFQDFDYQAYLARQGISSVMAFPEATLISEDGGSPLYRRLYSGRQRLADSLARVVPEPQASVLQALLLGLRENLPEDLREEFNATGTSHLLAISGLHVGVLLGVTMGISQALLGRRRQLYLLLPFALVWLYALVTGMSPSVVRAAIMASLYLSGHYLGRPGSILPALGVAAALMVVLSPNILWSVSFQLSFAAIGGIALFGPPLRLRLREMVEGHVGEGWLLTAGVVLAEAAAVALAATVATLPLVAFYFHRVSLVGIPATLVSLPALPFVLSFGALTALVGIVSPVVAQPLGWIAWLWGAYLTGVVHLFSLIPGGSLQVGRVAPALLWGYYGLLLLVPLRASWRAIAPSRMVRFVPLSSRGWPLGKAVPWWVLAPLLAAAALLWIAALSFPDGKLRVTFLDIDQGDAIFIVTPLGQQILVDGGSDPLGAVRALGERMPFWDRSLDLVILTHPHNDHVNGLLEVLRRYEVGHIVEREIPYETPGYQAWRQGVEQEGATVTQAQQGQLVALGGGVYIQVLGPGPRLPEGTSSDVDNSSVVLRLVYGQVSFLLTGDMHRDAEVALVSQDAPLHSTVLKVAHHGSRSSSSPAFLREVWPVAAVIMAGEDNRFGHPHSETLESLQQVVPEGQIFITGDRGPIQLTTDGTSLWVGTER